MKYFGDYIKAFLNTAVVVKGSEYDSDKCVLRMQSDEVLQEELIPALKAGDGNFFKWHGELITISGNSITSDHRNSRLKGFYAVNLKAEADTIHNDFITMINNYEQIVKINDQNKFGDVLSRFNESDYFKNAAINALNEFLSNTRSVYSHALTNRAALNADGKALLNKSLDSYSLKANWYDLEWIKENVNLGAFMWDFINEFNIDDTNKIHHEMLAKDFTYSFCNKQEFKAFSKFKFCRVTICHIFNKVSDWETRNDFKKAQRAISEAFIHQENYAAGNQVYSLDYKSLIDLGYGESKNLNCGIQIIRRKDFLQIKLPHKLTQQLQIFQLKFNRSGVEQNAA